MNNKCIICGKPTNQSLWKCKKCQPIQVIKNTANKSIKAKEKEFLKELIIEEQNG